MTDKDEQAQARISAARSTLEYALKLTEQADILEQLRELEKWRDESSANHKITPCGLTGIPQRAKTVDDTIYHR